MSITSHEPESADSLSHWTYFCFSTSSDHHPDANVGGSMSTDGSTSTDPGDNTVGVVGNGGGGGACVFSGTKISISSTEEIEVTKLRNNTHIAFCNPDTLEWST